MKYTLAGLTVLNTRPKALAHDLTRFVEMHGGECLACPAIEIQPIEKDWQENLPSQCDWVIFISQNAVKHSLPVLKQKWPAFPNVASIGKKTTDLLNSNHIQVALTAAQSNAESLLSASLLRSVKNKNIALVKGVGGRDILPETLKSRGAHLFTLNVYQRDCPNTLPAACKNIWKNNKRFIILGTSVDSINNLFTLFGSKATTWLHNTPWLVMSNRIKQHAISLGIKTAYVSPPNQLCETLLTLNKKGSNNE